MADRQQGGSNNRHPLALPFARLQIGTEWNQRCRHQLHKLRVAHEVKKRPGQMRRDIAQKIVLERTIPRLTIAAVNGYAVGRGWGLVLGRNLRVAVKGAEFRFPEVDLGAPLSPSMIALLAAHVRLAQMKKMILTCRHYTANDLLSVGMLNQIVTQEKLLPTVSALVQSLANKTSNAVMASKAT